MRVTQLNHVALHVADVAESSAFYGRVIGLDPLERPAFSFPGAWFRIGADQELHLIGRNAPDAPPPTERHFALAVDDLDGFAARLDEAAIEYRGPNPRPDGVRQIFVRDPDGHVVELCGAGPGA